MTTTRYEIGQWFDRGIKQQATHMIVVCDTFNHEDYPVFVKDGQSSRDVAAGYDGENMQRIMEVYDLSLDRESQLSATRVFNY